VRALPEGSAVGGSAAMRALALRTHDFARGALSRNPEVTIAAGGAECGRKTGLVQKRGQAALCQAPSGPFRQRSQTPFLNQNGKTQIFFEHNCLLHKI
jgi:hypothetical protein